MTGRTLEEIEALAADATPGPWGFLKHDCKELPSIDSFEITFQNKYGTAWLQSSNTHGVTMDRDMSRKETAANAALLASARDLLAIAQGQREEIKRLRKNHLFRMLQVVLYRYRAGLCKRSQTDKVDRFADRIRDALTV